MRLINLKPIFICVLVSFNISNATHRNPAQNTNHIIIDENFDLNNNFYLCSTTTWLEFKLNRNTPLENGKKWAWIGSITLKSKVPLRLEKLSLQWFGKKISYLQASLYQKKEKDPELIPIEKNLVCDGTWNNQTQELTFNINQKIISINNYYLLLSFPSSDEKTIKSGYFTLPDKKTMHLTKMD